MKYFITTLFMLLTTTIYRQSPQIINDSIDCTNNISISISLINLQENQQPASKQAELEQQRLLQYRKQQAAAKQAEQQKQLQLQQQAAAKKAEQQRQLQEQRLKNAQELVQANKALAQSNQRLQMLESQFNVQWKLESDLKKAYVNNLRLNSGNAAKIYQIRENFANEPIEIKFKQIAQQKDEEFRTNQMCKAKVSQLQNQPH